MSDRNLICFFSWGRRPLVQTSFENLLENVRPQDRIAVVDQAGYNIDFFTKHFDKIDFFTVFKKNYEIGPAWMYFKALVNWIIAIEEGVFIGKRPDDRMRAWLPDFVNVVESDTFGESGWIDKVVDIFNSMEPIGVASGYLGAEGEILRHDGDIAIKELNGAPQFMMKTSLFISLFNSLPTKSQDRKICTLIKDRGMVLGIRPGLIQHLGEGMGRAEGFKI